MSSRRLPPIIICSLLLSAVAAQGQWTISGTVRDPGAAPVSRVVVTLYTEQGDPVGGIDTTSTDSMGFYALGDGFIPSGTYNVGFEPRSSSELVPKIVPGIVVNGNTTLNVTLDQGYHLTGFVRDTVGQGIEGIDINAYYESDGQQVLLTNDDTGPDGSYDVLLPGALLRILYRPVGGENLVPVQQLNVNIVNDTTINIVMRAGWLVSGTVTGPGGTPVLGADIDVEDALTGSELYTPGDNTDADGNYQVRVPSGIHHIDVYPPVSDRLVPAIMYYVSVSGNTTVDFALIAGHILSGTVLNQSSNPVAGADIDVSDATTGDKIYTASDNTDANGYYQVVIPAGSYDVDFRPQVIFPYYAALRQWDITVIADRVLNGIVPNGRLIAGQVNTFRGNGLPGVNVDAIDSLNHDVPLVGNNTAPNGSFAAVMVPGLFDLEVKPGRFSGFAAEMLNSIRIRVDTSITVVLDSGMIVSGIVRDSTGAPFPRVAAIARENDGGVERLTPGNKTDLYGYYRIVIPPNMYDLVFKPDSTSGISDSVVLVDVSVMADMTFDVTFPFHSGDTLAPTVTVGSPNGGEQFPAFSNVPIAWTAGDNVGVTAVDIYYSTTGQNGPFTAIALGESNDGSYIWAVPAQPTTDAWIRISVRDASYNFAEDLSDGAFSIIYSAICCGGLKGDVNSNGVTNGLDVVYFVSYLKGGAAPPDTCLCSTHGRLLATSDANGNCTVNGIDITYMVAFFKGGPGLQCCPDCPSLAIRNDGGFFEY